MSSTPKEDRLTSRSKRLLEWGNDNKSEYQKWRRHMKAYAIRKSQTGRHGISDAE